MSPLQWLAIPFVVTLIAAFVVPWSLSRAARPLTDEERAARLKIALRRAAADAGAEPTDVGGHA